jgi:hypothetical protein
MDFIIFSISFLLCLVFFRAPANFSLNSMRVAAPVNRTLEYKNEKTITPLLHQKIARNSHCCLHMWTSGVCLKEAADTATGY